MALSSSGAGRVEVWEDTRAEVGGVLFWVL
jgi:hypothetical protein